MDVDQSEMQSLQDARRSNEQGYTSRLDRIEDKIDKLFQSLADIARIEERVLASTDRIDAIETRVIHLEQQHEEIRESMLGNSAKLANAERLFWFLLAASASAVGLSSNFGIF